MTSARPGCVIAGVDYSPASDTAVAQAARAAQRRDLALLLVHGFPAGVADETGHREPDGALITAARERLDEKAAAWRRVFPGLAISAKVVAGSGATALIDESTAADLIVVGPRGRGGFQGLLLGSVAAQVSTHARCPVVVAREAPPVDDDPGHPRPVLIGIDSSPQSAQALGFAFEDAATRDAGLLAVHVWSVPEMSALSVGRVWSQSPAAARAELRDSAEQVLVRALVGWQEKYPRLEVRRWSAHNDDAARTLLDVAATVAPGLIVVGCRGRGGFDGKLLGSVSQSVVAHAHCSVAVVHPRQ
jgi:nucleotide-binding universal stress UspA family protein